MVAKESVKTRFERPDQGISYTEFSYMLLQAYDFLRLHVDHGCEVQIGGSDQWGNITVGVELIRKVCGDEVWGLTTPLIVKPDGTKYGKTESGTVWLDPDSDQPFRHVPVLREHAGRTGRPAAPIPHLPESRRRSRLSTRRQRESPQRRAGQKALAAAVVALVHGESEVAKCEEASGALFGEGIARLSEEMLLAVTEDAPTTVIPRGEILDGLTLVDVLERTGLAKSKGDARRTIDQGGAYVNNVRQTDAARTLGPADLLHDRYVVVRKGATRGARRPGHMRRPFLIAFVVSSPRSALTLTSCAGADQQGDAAHRMSAWVSGTSLGGDIGTLIADNARVSKIAPNGAGRPARRLQHDAQRRGDGLRRAAVARPRREPAPQQRLQPRADGGQRLLRRRNH